MLSFSDDPPKVYEIPRLEDHLIDELFYQEDEIGEMRHTAFMIECGLEEDPPDGPDVPPIPWKFTPGTESTTNPTTAATETPTEPESPKRPKRDPPRRTSSMDDIEELESELSSPTRREPRRKLAVTQSGTFHGIRKPLPEKSHSADSIDNINDDASARRERRTAPVVRKPKMLVKAKSGSLHGLRDAARKVQEANNTNAAEEETSSPRSLRRSKLVATQSGTLHGMRKAAEETQIQQSPIAPVVRRKLVVTKSGTLHGMRQGVDDKAAVEAVHTDRSPIVPKRNGVTKAVTNALNGSSSKTTKTPTNKKKNTERKSSSENSSDSEDESLSRFDNSSSDLESDVSLDTDEDVPKTPTKKKDVLQKIPLKSLTRSSIVRKVVEEAKPTEKEIQEETKPRNRVFRNGKLVIDDGGTPDKSLDEIKVNGAHASSVKERLRNFGNASMAEPTNSTQSLKPIPRKNISSLGIPAAFQNQGVVPSLFQPSQQLSGEKVRPGKLKIPIKAKSVSVTDIPPAFRAGVGK